MRARAEQVRFRSQELAAETEVCNHERLPTKRLARSTSDADKRGPKRGALPKHIASLTVHATAISTTFTPAAMPIVPLFVVFTTP